MFGLLTVLGLLVTAIVCSRMVRTLVPDPGRQQMGQAPLPLGRRRLGLAFYDGLGFPMAGGFLFLVLVSRRSAMANRSWRERVKRDLTLISLRHVASSAAVLALAVSARSVGAVHRREGLSRPPLRREAPHEQ